MTDRPQSVQLEVFEHVLAVPGIALLRVLATRSRRRGSGSRPILVIRDQHSTCRFAPIPAPDDPRGVLRVAYSVPVELLEQEGISFALEFQTGGPLTLPLPTIGSARLPARGGEQEPVQSGAAEAVPDADLEEDRRIDIHQRLVQQSQALADSERAAAAHERSHRSAKAKLQAAVEQHQEEEQRASTRVHELEQQLERQAAEIVARIAASDAELTRAQSAVSDADERATLAEKANAESSAALQELETWREELERRLAELTSELAATKKAFEDAERERRRLDGELSVMQSERDAAQAQAQATLATLRGELEDARVHAAHSDDLEREIEVSRGEADRLQAAVVSLESEIRTTGQGELDPLRNGSDRELTAVSSALDGAREEMNALRRELELALASERKANLELVMLTAETQARLQAQTELKQAAHESGLTQ